METTVLYQNVQRLPASLQQEANDFITFLLNKYSAKDVEDMIRPHAGCMKGTFIKMSDDFNAPLDDFQDYQ